MPALEFYRSRFFDNKILKYTFNLKVAGDKKINDDARDKI